MIYSKMGYSICSVCTVFTIKNELYCRQTPYKIIAQKHQKTVYYSKGTEKTQKDHPLYMDVLSDILTVFDVFIAFEKNH
jgi:hypothetical protein